MMLDLSNKRYGERGVMFFADCAVIPEPTVEQLATIAVQTGHDLPPAHRQQAARRDAQLFHERERQTAVAGEGRRRHGAREAESGRMPRIEMEIDGELQADTALLPDLAERKAPPASSRVARTC